MPEATDLRIGPYAGAVTEAHRSPALLARLANMAAWFASPDANALGAGRHRSVILKLDDGPRSARFVAKRFRRQPALKDWVDRRRGSKARRTWRHAWFLQTAGVGTPQPVAFLERWQGGRLLESYFLTAHQEDLRSFRQELIRLFREDPQCWKLMALLQCVAEAIRAMHAAGFRHNDLGNQNILLHRAGDGAWDRVQFVDLNRGRMRRPLPLHARARDLSRIHLPSDLLRVFKEMYFAPDVPPAAFQTWERRYRRAYAWHCRTRAWRHPLRTTPERAALPPESEYPPEKDLWVWDERSGQPVNVMQSADRRRFLPLGDHLRTIGTVLSAAAPVWREYRRLMRACFANPVNLSGRIGVALSGRLDAFERELRLLEPLGRIPVLVRCYRHTGRAGWQQAEEIVRSLHARGFPVTLALVQDRQAVRDPAQWDAFVADVLRRAAPYVEWLEIGHAVNRVKWGLWTHAEHRRLLEGAARAAQAFPQLRLMGPAAIDFEYAALLTALRNRPAGLHFGALSHHLYVDRRGAPENTQAGFSALEKFALARAIARQAKACDDRLIVSEVNWPLKGTGVYSPVGAPYESPGPRLHDPSVGEDECADYLLRYLLLALCSGMVERIFWWRLAARGYGLVDDSEPERWRERPAYRALKHFLAVLGNSTFVAKAEWPSPAGAGKATCFRFERPCGERVCLAYSPAGPVQVRIPLAASRLTDALDRELGPVPPACPLDGSPVYLRNCSGTAAPFP